MDTPCPRRPTDTTALSVLIVDDFRDAADSLTDLLRMYGHGVQAAYNPEAALAAELADVVILELRLPGMDGWELVRRMRARDASRHTFYVALTTCGRGADRRKSNDAGIDLHLMKPAEPDALINALNGFARTRRPSPR